MVTSSSRMKQASLIARKSSQVETNAAVKMIVDLNKSPSLQPIGRSLTVFNAIPLSSTQIVPVSKVSPIKNTSNNNIYPPCGSGRITILQRETTHEEIVGTVKRARLEAQIINNVNMAPSASSIPFSDFSLIPIPSQTASTSKSNRVPLSDQLPYLIAHAQPSREYAYKSGVQYPADISKPKGSTIETILNESPEIEILSVFKKGSLSCYSVYCHACQKDKNCSAKDLDKHRKLACHRRCLTAPAHLEVDPKEHSRRLLLLSNAKFASFLHLEEGDQTLWCKVCNVQLPVDHKKISSHRYNRTHLASIEQGDDFTEAEKLRVLSKIVDTYPDAMALVTEFDKRVNDEYFEPYKSPEQITLQVNDLYCKFCRLKIFSSNPNHYFKTVQKHLQSKRHLREVQEAQEATDKQRKGRMPLRKIATFKHDKEDLKELTRVLIETKMPIARNDSALQKVTQATIHRKMSTEYLKKIVKSMEKNNIISKE